MIQRERVRKKESCLFACESLFGREYERKKEKEYKWECVRERGSTRVRYVPETIYVA